MKEITTTIGKDHNVTILFGNEEWEAMTSAERAALTYYHAALASPPSAIERKLILFGMVLYEAFDTLTRQDAVKDHNDKGESQ